MHDGRASRPYYNIDLMSKMIRADYEIILKMLTKSEEFMMLFELWEIPKMADVGLRQKSQEPEWFSTENPSLI